MVSDTSFLDTVRNLLLSGLSENTGYQLKIWHSCPLYGEFSDTITINFNTPACPIVTAGLSYQNFLP